MEYNFYNLDKFDIIFLFENLESLSLATKTKLIINRDNIINNLKNELTNEETNIILSASNVTISDKLARLGIDNKPNLLSSIITMHSESIEDIVTIIRAFRNLVRVNDSQEIYKVFYKHILKDKIYVYSILQKALLSDTDDSVFISSIKTIYDLWISTSNNHVTAIATSMLYSVLQIDDDSILDFLIHSTNVLSGYGRDDILQILRQVKDVGLVEYDVPEAETKDVQVPLEDTSETINIIGDDLFSDRPQFIHDLKNEIVKLDTDSITRYIGHQDSISYKIDPQSLGYLISNKDFLVAKVNIKDMGIYTIVKYEGVLYLLFELGEDTIQGISFPVDAGGERKIIAIQKDNNVEYSIKEPDLE